MHIGVLYLINMDFLDPPPPLQDTDGKQVFILRFQYIQSDS